MPVCRKKFLSRPRFERQLSSSWLVILVKYLDSYFLNMYSDTYMHVVLTSIGHLTPKLSTNRVSVARYVRGICPGFFPSWNHTLLMQFCLGSGEQISVNRLCVKGNAKANMICSSRSNTESVVWLEACLWLMIIIKTIIEGNKCFKVNCADSHTKLLCFWNHTKFQLRNKVRAQTMLRGYSFVTGSLQTCVRKCVRIWHT